ncbi:hypothetical protein H0X48_00880 [Candidatus Dependentiae bacterium]|nr:hypothetical protein [Candidatus Dependentiae bacterium]
MIKLRKLVLFILFLSGCIQIQAVMVLSSQLRELLESFKGETALAQALNQNSEPSKAVESFFKGVDFKGTPQTKAELAQFVSSARAIQNEFLRFPSSNARYDQLLSALKNYKTRLGSDLSVWAQRFLSVNALIIALGAVDKTDIEETNKSGVSNKLDEDELSSLAELIAHEFVINLRGLQAQFKFEIPEGIEQIITQKELIILKKYLVK